MARSIWAVIGGLLFIVVVTTLVDVVLLAIPQCWAGGKIYEMQVARR